MIDEFIYQFQSFCQFRGSSPGKPRRSSRRWTSATRKGSGPPTRCLTFWRRWRRRSGSPPRGSGARRDDEVLGDGGVRLRRLERPAHAWVLLKLIGTARVRILLGDYESALRALRPDRTSTRPVCSTKSGASVSTAYHVGFAYFMLGRYTDAARHFNRSLVFVNRHKVAATRPYALDLLLKKQEQMYAACAMAVILGGNGSSNGARPPTARRGSWRRASPARSARSTGTTWRAWRRAW